MKTRNYIEFRVFYEDGLSPEVVDDIAETLKDVIVDYMADNLGIEGMTEMTQDVTYEKVVEILNHDQ
jgi:hypothetical protein